MFGTINELSSLLQNLSYIKRRWIDSLIIYIVLLSISVTFQVWISVTAGDVSCHK